MAGAYTELAHVLPMVVNPYNIVVRIFLLMGQFIGLYGSSGPCFTYILARFKAHTITRRS